MRYSKTHKEETRRKLLDSSRALVKQGGFDSTGVDSLMSAIGLTSGAFYTHFPSKQALLEAVIQEEIDNSVELLSVPEVGNIQDVNHAVALYLSNAHAQHPETGCVLPALGAEISRTPPKIRFIVESGLKQLHGNWEAIIGDSDAAWSVISQCVGALTIARTVKSEKARTEILEANRRHIGRLVSQLLSLK
ncbi:TetR/AcrR family transcriptional regulator [Glaciimonas soli]|uniref:TetR family transcriptional regulator n=1 Tax=Glaciimonas soli TaxID=2590999 RepID=A0A843YT00_9BURK|nr:TetR/AcrR family transcriptional regulator [Glaciimonas soli]MQR00713.1 TetR family transcriptional regulator [Glaciimonas soli]